MVDNPQQALDAIANPNPITLGQIALLQKINSPVLRGEVTDMTECFKAIYVTEVSRKEVVKHLANIDEESIAHCDNMPITEYRAKLKYLLNGIAEFYEMLPKSGDDATGKK